MGLASQASAQSQQQPDAPVAKADAQDGSKGTQAQRASRSSSKPDQDWTGDPGTQQQGSGGGSPNWLLNAGKDFLEDQKQVVTSPARLRFVDSDWLPPAAGIFTGLLTTDRDFSSHLSTDQATMNHRSTLSNAGL